MLTPLAPTPGPNLQCLHRALPPAQLLPHPPTPITCCRGGVTGTETPLFHPNFPPQALAQPGGRGWLQETRGPLPPATPFPPRHRPHCSGLGPYSGTAAAGQTDTSHRDRGAGLILRLFIGISLSSPRAPRPRRLVPGSPVGTAGVLLCRDPRNPPLFVSLEPPGHRPHCVPLTPKGIEIKPAPKPREGRGVAAVAAPPPASPLQSPWVQIRGDVSTACTSRGSPGGVAC